MVVKPAIDTAVHMHPVCSQRLGRSPHRGRSPHGSSDRCGRGAVAQIRGADSVLSVKVCRRNTRKVLVVELGRKVKGD